MKKSFKIVAKVSKLVDILILPACPSQGAADPSSRLASLVRIFLHAISSQAQCFDHL